MANTYCKLAVHVIFAVKNRNALIPFNELSLFHRFINGVVSTYDEKCFVYAVGGTPNHVHLLINIPPAVSLSDIVKEIKVASSKFAASRLSIPFKFEWQRGFAAISVSPSNIETVRRYINNQVEHHHNVSLRSEMTSMFQRAGLEFDEQYMFEDI